MYVIIVQQVDAVMVATACIHTQRTDCSMMPQKQSVNIIVDILTVEFRVRHAVLNTEAR